MKLNLGACDRPFPGFLSVDIVPPADLIADLARPWPWEDSSVDEVRAHDVIEHIGDEAPKLVWNYQIDTRPLGAWRSVASGGEIPPGTAYLVGERAESCIAGVNPRALRCRHPSGRIHFMNELHRVLKPGARATIETPNASRGAGFYQDPTHKSPWCLNSFQYFEAGSFAHQRLAKSYGITAAFRIIQLTERSYQDVREEVWKITAVLEAVK
jgi:hypothetical protein